MKPIINLYFDFEFTSLSPDAQPISLGIVSEETKPCDFPEAYKGRDSVPWREYQPKSFYAEFTDFDINRCDDWVKENVVDKLRYKNALKSNGAILDLENNPTILGWTDWVKSHLTNWLDQFSEYNIQFVCDCGTFDWYWMLQLIGEWEAKENPDDNQLYNHCPTCGSKGIQTIKLGLPKLPENISPVPQDLNDLIALKKGISVMEAFELNREDLVSSMIDVSDQVEFWGKSGKHNALWDAKVIKEIYNKLK